MMLPSCAAAAFFFFFFFGVGTNAFCLISGLTPFSLPAYLSTVTVKDPEYGRVALVGDVGEHLEAVLHVISPPLDGVHGHVVVLELPGFGELRIQDTEASQPVILHHLRHFPLHHLHGVPAGLDDGFHLVGVEEVAPQRQTDAQQEQCLRPEEKITHDPTQKRQERHCVSYHHTQPSCSLSLSLFLHSSLHPLSGHYKEIDSLQTTADKDCISTFKVHFDLYGAPRRACLSLFGPHLRAVRRGWLPDTGPGDAGQKRTGHLH